MKRKNRNASPSRRPWARRRSRWMTRPSFWRCRVKWANIRKRPSPSPPASGRYGAYVKHGHTYARLRADDVLTVGLNRAVDLLAEAESRSKGATLGEHPKDRKPIKVRSGRFGPYLQHGTNRAALPKGTNADALTSRTSGRDSGRQSRRPDPRRRTGSKKERPRGAHAVRFAPTPSILFRRVALI